MAMTDEMQEIALKTRPDTLTLDPESRKELTTEGGFDVIKHEKTLQSFLLPLFDANIRVSLFIDPDLEQIKMCDLLKIKAIELSTASFVEAKTEEERTNEFERLQKAASVAHGWGMEVAAGHGLDYTNVARVATISEIVEFNIGHSIIARAIFVGLEDAIKEMLRLLGY
jgi:pyridoxine 5-phosphate synthase